MMISALYAAALYAATLVLVLGVAARVLRYARTPAPLKIPTTPAPRTHAGVVLRMGREIVLFESLFKANLWIWVFGWMFHAALLAVLARHLRYFTQPIWSWVWLLQPFAVPAALAMIAGLAGLWARRFFVERIRFISTPSDHLMLALLIGIATTGVAMTALRHTDVVGVKAFVQAWMKLTSATLPPDGLLLIHLGLVLVLMLVFPFSKLLHAPGVFFSPTRNQTDNPRSVRHVAPWAAKFDVER